MVILANKIKIKVNKLEILAHDQDNFLYLSQIKEELNKNKDYRDKPFYVNQCIEYFNNTHITVITDNYIKPFINELLKLVETAKQNKNVVQLYSVNKILIDHNSNTPNTREETYEFFKLHKIDIIETDLNANNNIDDSDDLDDSDSKILDEDESIYDALLDDTFDDDFENENIIDSNVAYTSDPVKAYLNDIAKLNTHLLSSEEEIELAHRVQAGDNRAKDILVNSNLKLVISVAKRYQKSGLPLMDLSQDGNIGLMKAVSMYNPDLGFRFSTYATHWIKQSILRGLANNSRMIRLPVHAVEQARKNQLAINELTEKLGRMPTFEEAADYINENKLFSKSITHISPETVQLYYMFYNPETVSSYNAPIPNRDGDNDSELVDFIEDTNESVEESVIKDDMREKLDYVLNTFLTDKEADILRLRFGINADHSYTLEELGVKYKVTRERIRQIEGKAIRKIRRSAKARKYLRGYFESNPIIFSDMY